MKPLEAHVAEYSAQDATTRGTGFGSQEQTTTTVRLVVTGADASKVGNLALRAALDATASKDLS